MAGGVISRSFQLLLLLILYMLILSVVVPLQFLSDQLEVVSNVINGFAGASGKGHGM